MNNKTAGHSDPDLYQDTILSSGNSRETSWKDYIYAIPFHKKYIVYQPLKKLAFIANQSMVGFIRRFLNGEAIEHHSVTSDAYRFLNSVGFFEPVSLPGELSVIPSSFKPTVGVLLLTTSCNFRCIYCYASSGSKKGNVMASETGYAAIDTVCRNAKEAGEACFSLNFHGGGEPTTAWTTFCDLVRYARMKDLPASISVSTNGYWDRRKLQWMMDNMDEISLSCDGIPVVQNSQRPLRSGGETFDRVIETIRMLDRRKKAYGIRLTVTESAIDTLPESILFFCKETACQSFQAEPAFDHGRAKLNGTALVNQQRFIRSFLTAYDIAGNYGRKLFYSGARPELLTGSFCQAPLNALVVSNKGQLTACYEVFDPSLELGELFFIGSMDTEQTIRINEGKRRFLLSRIEERRKLCRGCFCFWHCAGDCPAKTLTPEGDGHWHEGVRCIINRGITAELLLRKIYESDGVWQGDRSLQTLHSPVTVSQ